MENVGTGNPALLDDPIYLGARLDELPDAIATVFPHALVLWENVAKSCAASARMCWSACRASGAFTEPIIKDMLESCPRPIADIGAAGPRTSGRPAIYPVGLKGRAAEPLRPGVRRWLSVNLYLVRHGQTSFSRENRFCGTSDPALTDVGQAMAEAFATAYAETTWDAIYTSPMVRARQTAAPLERLTGVTAIVEGGLTEIAYGEWEGLTIDGVKARWPQAYDYWAEHVASRGTPGGETAFHVAARAMRVVES